MMNYISFFLFWFHLYIIYCNELDILNTLDIEDYQFHFKTFQYKFDIKPIHQIIQYPFNDDLNITLDIDFNETISLSFNNEIFIDFFNMDDFTEISYITVENDVNSFINHRQRSLLIVDDKNDENDDNHNENEAKAKALAYLEKEAQKEINHVGHNQDKERGLRSNMNTEGMDKNWRNHAFDRGMSGYPHPRFPNLRQFRRYKRFNERVRDRSEYDEYRRKRNRVSHRGGEIYDRFHNDKYGDLAGHDALSLQRRYHRKHKIRGERYKVKGEEYPPPPDKPRKVPYHHGKYIGVPIKKTWFMAQQFCREQYGTNLASIMNIQEQNELRHVCDEVAGYGHCWIGLQRPFGTWQDGKPVMMTNFGQNGVNNLHEQPVNCIEILSINNNKEWNAQLCTVRRPFICEIPRKRTRGKYIAIGKTLSWESAENYCQQTYNTDLASIETKKENRLAMNLCRDISSDMHHCWIGLIKPYNQWTDGTQIEYSNFKQGWAPDHKGLNLFENKKEEPEPYGEDDQSDNKYTLKAKVSITEQHRRRRRLNTNHHPNNPNNPNHPQQHHHHPHHDHAAPPDMPQSQQSEQLEQSQQSEQSQRSQQSQQDGTQQLEQSPQSQQSRQSEQSQQSRQSQQSEQSQQSQRPQQSERDGYPRDINTRQGGEEQIRKELEQMQKQEIAEEKRERLERGDDGQNHNTEKKATPNLGKYGDNHGNHDNHHNNDHKGHGPKMKKILKHNGYEHQNEKEPPQINEEEEDRKDVIKPESEDPDKEYCAQINTSYGGVWDKSRCSFRHFFICNNPAYEQAKENKDREPDFWGRRRRILYDDENDEEFLGGMLRTLRRKASLMLGGSLASRMNGRRNRGYLNTRLAREFDRWKHGRHRRRRVRRRKRRRRRRRFRKWLRRHYGRGRRNPCGPRCPYKKMKIRSLPKDMHWSPLSGLLPMFGVQALHRPKKSPKIHIVAKVHLPKHRTVDNGYLDYDLLDHLLFGDNDAATNRKNRVMDDWNRKERKIERKLKRTKTKRLTKQYDAEGNFEEQNSIKRQMDREDRNQNRKFDQPRHHRRLLVSSSTNSYGNDIDIVSRCKIINLINSNYEICFNYYINDMSFTFNIKSLDYKLKRINKRRIFRNVMNINQNHYKDYQITDKIDIIDYPMDDVNDVDDNIDNDDEYVLFESIDGNLGYAIFKYESMDWHLNDKNNKYQYGEFDNFKNYIRFNEEFNLIVNVEHFNMDFKCSETLTGLPFKLCLKQIDKNNNKHIMLYFEKDDDKNVLDPHFSFRFKEFIDDEFESFKVIFDENMDWDEINEIDEINGINANEIVMEKCNYLHIAKVCIKHNKINNTMTASISFQLMNKNRMSQNIEKLSKLKL